MSPASPSAASAAARAAAPRPWLRCWAPRANPAGRIVCFPHAGGSASFFHRWRTLVGPETELWAVQYPAREDRISEPPARSVDELVAGVLGELPPLLDRPTVLFGHSMGASVAYETAVALSRRGGPGPRAVVVSARRPPGRHVPSVPGGKLTDELVEQSIRMLGGTAVELLEQPEMREFILTLVANDYRLIDAYEPTDPPRLDIPLVAFAAVDDPGVPVPEAERWADLAPPGFELVLFPGGHFYLADQAASVAAAVGEVLDRAIRGAAADGGSGAASSSTGPAGSSATSASDRTSTSTSDGDSLTGAVAATPGGWSR